MNLDLNQLDKQPAYRGALYIPSRYARQPPREPGRGQHALSMPASPWPGPSLSALHEWGHVIALWANGYRVAFVNLSECRPAGEVCPRVWALAAAAGRLAEDLTGHGRGRASLADNKTFQRAIRESGVDPSVVNAAAESLLAEHRGEVIFGADCLDEMELIGPAQFAEICRRPGSPLAAYGRWYPKPGTRSTKPRALSRQSVQCRAGIF
jgi:hypothetical protein